MVRVPRCLLHSQLVDANTIIGDKMMGSIIPGGRVSAPMQFGADGWPINDSYHEIVLRSSTQCLPMVKFDRALRDHKAGKDCIRNLKHSLQMILDRLFNQGLSKSTILSAPLIGPVSVRSLPRYGMAGMPFPPGGLPPHFNPQQMQSLQAVFAHSNQALMTAIGGGNVPATAQPTVTPTMGVGASAVQPTAFGMNLNPVSARKTQANKTPTSTLHYVAPESLSTSVPSNALIAPPSDCNMKDKCAICQERLEKRRCVALKICSHVFHKGCIKLAFQSKLQCPVCRVPIGALQGKSPSGTMSVSVNPIRCSGFQCDTLVISYNIPAARQMSYHDNPGVTHGSKVATAYVPNNEEGINLMKRLKFAFKHGLTFTVGTSMTSGMTDQCTW
jgi:deltex-like protein